MQSKYNYKNILFGREEELKFSPFYPGYFHLNNALKGLLKVKGRILDVGCGQGASIKAIKKIRPDLDFFAIDVGKLSLKIAQKDPQGINFKYGSAYKIPFKSNFFDAVVSFDVLEHLDTPDIALKEIKRVLKKGGKFIFSCPVEGQVPSIHGLLWQVFKINLKRKHVGHVQMYTLIELKQRLKKAGFKIKSIGYSSYFFNQILDLSYFVLAHLQKKEAGEKVVVPLPSSTLAQKVGSFINFIEGRVFSFIPGQTIHIISVN